VNSQHLYLHVPFCRLVCAYCDFVTVGGRADDIPRYVRALAGELAMRPPQGPPETVYFGGGTPSLLPASDVAELLDAAVGRWAVRPTEVTLEANPGTREAPDWVALRAAGVNRISLGAQSLDDRQLRVLARGHDAAEVRAAYSGARTAGFDNVSLDLIYGIPGQSVADWRRDLADLIALAPEHVSLYALQLVLDPDEWAAPPRPGALRWRARLAGRQDDVLAEAQYRAAEEMLDAAGYGHYEVSSWARPGFESRHNGAYWDRRPYVGIGAGAHSYDGAARRAWNERDLDRYLDAVEAERLPEAGFEELDEPTRAFEAVALGLRRVGGMDRAAFGAEFGVDPVVRWPAAMATAQERALLGVESDRMWLTAAGRLLANEVLLGFLPDSASAPPPHHRQRAGVGS
jgi:oxygen-independent coproporphyrinogen-3 oxidase